MTCEEARIQWTPAALWTMSQYVVVLGNACQRGCATVRQGVSPSATCGTELVSRCLRVQTLLLRQKLLLPSRRTWLQPMCTTVRCRRLAMCPAGGDNLDPPLPGVLLDRSAVDAVSNATTTDQWLNPQILVKTPKTSGWSFEVLKNQVSLMSVSIPALQAGARYQVPHHAFCCIHNCPVCT
jgi:hypothetical protein